jgi:hypothetical protein
VASILLNAAMLSGTVDMQPFMDFNTINLSSGDYLVDYATGAAYYDPGRVTRMARLTTELYRWVPMGTTYTVSYIAGAELPPLDPTLW